MNASQRPRAVVFDVIGTLFSLESQRPRLLACGLPRHALEAWFAASLRDLFTLGVTGRTAPMIGVLRDNLLHLLAQNHLRQDGLRVDSVLQGMAELEPDPTAREAIEILRSRGLACAALSNGSLQATEALLDRAGLRALLAQTLSIDSVGLPKPRGEVYRAMAELLDLPPQDLLMVAAHPWDLHGARAAGLSTAYVSRGLPWPASLDAPDLTAPGLVDIARLASQT
jgi:2-haloacid dehalogenase